MLTLRGKHTFARSGLEPALGAWESPGKKKTKGSSQNMCFQWFFVNLHFVVGLNQHAVGKEDKRGNRDQL